MSQALAAAEGFHRWCLGGREEVYLNVRPKDLHNKLAPQVQDKLGIDIDQWASWAVWARNHVAHGGTNRRRPLRDSFQLNVIAQTVHLVTYLAALQEFAVPVDKLRDALLNHPRLSVMAQRCSEINQLGERL